MPSQETRTTSHDIEVDAPPETVFGIISNAVDWPLYFTPNLHVEQTPLDAGTERLAIWATANGEVKHWTSKRWLDRDARRIRFRQEKSAAPVVSMGGEWVVAGLPGGRTSLTLLHDFQARDEAGLAWLETATDRNSRTELANIKALAERWDRLDRITSTFEDSRLIKGDPAAVYEFLRDAARWPERLPHVSGMDLEESGEGNAVQRMRMETSAQDGSTHTTESVRICLPPDRIVYKQVVTPALMDAHTGEWSLEETAEGVLAVSRHSVVLNEEAVLRVLGEEATEKDALAYIRKALGANSSATLGFADEYTRGES
ncbi:MULTISPECIES: aromatase/cyclase [unclassified Nocardiopsis]|uniref:aromatase/cyclase n=1 Tax=Nocardiopsis TaxID=2013 RepID=UPI00387AFFC0